MFLFFRTYTHAHTPTYPVPETAFSPFSVRQSNQVLSHSHVIRTYKDLLAPKAPNLHRDKEILLWQQLLIFSFVHKLNTRTINEVYYIKISII